MNHIFYQTKTQYSNTGDALINNALINELRQYGVLHVNCSVDIPQDFLNTLGIREEERENSEGEFSFVKAVLRQAVKCRKTKDHVFLFSGPGDLYGGSSRLVIRNLISGLVFPIFRLCGVIIVRIGRSVGPISSMMAVSEWIRGLFLSHYYVRDTVSLERCHKLGIKKTKLCPDLSWIYHCDHPKRINKTNAVMVTLRNSIYDEVEEDFVESTIERCKEVIAELCNSMEGKAKIYVTYQVEEDKKFCEYVAEQLKATYNVEFVDHQLRLSDMEKYYGCVDYHVSNRMHSLLVGYKYGSLPIALINIEKHIKIAATLKDSQMENLMVDIEASDAEWGFMNEREMIMQKLFSYEKNCQRDIEEILSSIFESVQLN